MPRLLDLVTAIVGDVILAAAFVVFCSIVVDPFLVTTPMPTVSDQSFYAGDTPLYHVDVTAWRKTINDIDLSGPDCVVEKDCHFK